MTSRVFNHPLSWSLALHLFLLWAGLWFASKGPQISKPPEILEVSLTPDLPSPKSSSKESTLVQRSAGQEVEQAKKDAFLSDRTRSVVEERSSRNEGELRSKNAEKGRNARKTPRVSDFGVRLQTGPQTRYENERNWAQMPLGESLQGGQYIQGMKEGEFSALNTKEFVFYSYFERVRRQLDQSWQPILRENVKRILKAGRNLASRSDYVTRTLVTMNEKGEILRIQMIEESGTADLDQAAVDALNKAGPYPNPPKGLIDQSGQVKIRWDFILRT